MIEVFFGDVSEQRLVLNVKSSSIVTMFLEEGKYFYGKCYYSVRFYSCILISRKKENGLAGRKHKNCLKRVIFY